MLAFHSDWEPAPRRTPPATTLLAVGDVHGCADHLIREPFLTGAGWSHDFAVVHGHTPLGPDVQRHRIGVDSGCFRTGALTAVELTDDRLRFHVVADLAMPNSS